MTIVICICCSRTGKTEQHHVARRLHSQGTACKASCVKVPVCISCHQVLTLWDSERSWPASKVKVQAYSRPWANRLVVGALDVFRLAALRESDQLLPVSTRKSEKILQAGTYKRLNLVMGMIADAQRVMRFTVRPSRVMPDIEPVPMNLKTAQTQAEMLNRMTREVFARSGINITITDLRKAG
jgi:hypothetical protein